jgi:hypothetical protein
VSLIHQCTWKAVGLHGHSEAFGSEFLYTSQSAPVEADEYERMKQRAEAAEAAEAALPSEQVRNVIAEMLYRSWGTNPERYPAGVRSVYDWLQLFRV